MFILMPIRMLCISLLCVMFSFGLPRDSFSDDENRDIVKDQRLKFQKARDYEREYAKLSHQQKLIASCFKADKELVIRAFRNGADVNSRFGKTNVTFQLIFNDRTLVSEEKVSALTPLTALLLSSNIDQDAPEPAQSVEGRKDILDLLLSHNCDCNMDNGYGKTPVFISAERNDFYSLKVLLEYGANPNMVFRGGIDGIRDVTPLHKAVESYDCFAVLLNYGAEPERADSEGLTPIDWCERLNTNHRIVKTAAGWGVQKKK